MLAFIITHELTHHSADVLPTTIDDALRSEAKEKWVHVIEDEMHALVKNRVFEVQDLPPERKKVKCKWVFDIKRDANGKVIRHKARLVAKGFTQKGGVDYQEVFSPVTKFERLRFLLSYVAAYNLELEQVDVRTTFSECTLGRRIIHEYPTPSCTFEEEI